MEGFMQMHGCNVNITYVGYNITHGGRIKQPPTGTWCLWELKHP